MAPLVRSLQTQNLSPNLRLRWAANQKADAMCISQTPAEALKREWAEHGIDRYVKIIAGQEMGTAHGSPVGSLAAHALEPVDDPRQLA